MKYKTEYLVSCGSGCPYYPIVLHTWACSPSYDLRMSTREAKA